MARRITIVIEEDLSNEEYADFGNGIWGVLKMARMEGGFHLEADRGQVDYLNERWAQHGGEFPVAVTAVPAGTVTLAEAADEFLSSSRVASPNTRRA